MISVSRGVKLRNLAEGYFSPRIPGTRTPTGVPATTLAEKSVALDGYHTVRPGREHIFLRKSTFPCHSPAIYEMAHLPAAVVGPKRELGARLFGPLQESWAGNTGASIDF